MEIQEARRLAYECIRAAKSRKPAKQTFDGHRLRGATFDRRVRLVGNMDLRAPLVGVLPEKVIEPRKNQDSLSLSIHPFSDRELQTMSQALPTLEPLLGDTVFFINPGKMLPSQTWNEGMGMDERNYYTIIDPMIVEETAKIDLPENGLVCDPACGTGRLFLSLKPRFPRLRYVGADANQEVIRITGELHPNIPIFAGDAREMDYLPPHSVALFILSGLVNKSVVTPEAGAEILRQAVAKARKHAYIMITGKTLPLFHSRELARFGLQVLLRTKWQFFSFFPFYLCRIPALKPEKLTS